MESADWPKAMAAYGASLLALSVRCEQPSAKAEVYRWFMREAGGSLTAFGDDRRAGLRDAFHEMVARIPGLLLRFRAGLGSERSPNLKSMLVCWIRWRASELEASRRRYTSRAVPVQLNDRAAPGRPDLTVHLAEVLALLDGADPTARALRLVGLGHTIAAAARLTGVSRQQIYRAREVLTKMVDAEPDDGG